MDISIADIAASTTAGLILWAIKKASDNRTKIEAKLETNRDQATDALNLVSHNVNQIGTNVSTLTAVFDQHQREDDRRFGELKQGVDKIWESIERRHT